MADTRYKPIRHDHDAFLGKAKRRRGFEAAYQALAIEYAVASEMLRARSRAGLTQEAVATHIQERRVTPGVRGQTRTVTYFAEEVCRGGGVQDRDSADSSAIGRSEAQRQPAANARKRARLRLGVG